MISRTLPMLYIATSLLAGAATSASAQEQTAAPWQFDLTPYLWGTSVNGTIGIGPVSAPVDLSFSQIISDFDFGFMGTFVARKGPWGGFIDAVYADLAATKTRGIGLDLSAREKMTLATAGVSYQFDPIPLGSTILTFEPYVGARYTRLRTTINGNIGFTPIDNSATPEWGVAVVGTRVGWDFSERWTSLFLGDLGGFNPGVNFQYQLMGLLGYRFDLFQQRDATVLVGYRYLNQVYKTGADFDRRSLDWALQGPAMGLWIRF